MTNKEINNISLADAQGIALKHKMKIDFNTTDAQIKAFARKILREGKRSVKFSIIPCGMLDLINKSF